jgi:hypothetical protein
MLVEDIEDSILLQNLGVESTDPIDRRNIESDLQSPPSDATKYIKLIIQSIITAIILYILNNIDLKKKKSIIFIPVFHLLVSVVRYRQDLIEAVVGRVAGGMVDDGCVSGTEEIHYFRKWMQVKM